MDLLITLDTLFSSVNQTLLNNLFCLGLATAALMNKRDNNVLLLVSVLLIPKLFDILFLNNFLLNSGLVKKHNFFLAVAAFDLIIMLMILFRAALFRLVSSVLLRAMAFLTMEPAGTYRVELNYRRDADEFLIIKLYALAILVSLVTSAEYAGRYYISEQILVAYHAYTPLKVIISVIEIAVLFNIGFRSQRNNNAIANR